MRVSSGRSPQSSPLPLPLPLISPHSPSTRPARKHKEPHPHILRHPTTDYGHTYVTRLTAKLRIEIENRCIWMDGNHSITRETNFDSNEARTSPFLKLYVQTPPTFLPVMYAASQASSSSTEKSRQAHTCVIRLEVINPRVRADVVSKTVTSSQGLTADHQAPHKLTTLHITSNTLQNNSKIPHTQLKIKLIIPTAVRPNQPDPTHPTKPDIKKLKA